MSEPSLPLAGGCMCGTVRFEIARPLLGALYCHCTRCQKRTGTAFSATAAIEPGSLTITQGADEVRDWDPGDGGWIKAFCGTCGSHVWTTHADDPTLIGVRLGAIEGDPGIRPALHKYTDYAPAWAPVPDDGLPRFGENFAVEKPPPSAA